MSNDNTKNSLEAYKELGLQFRHYASEITSTNRLMLPPLVIGLLVLYGEVEKFLGVEINNPEAVHQLVGLGCVTISMIWIFNVSRLAQLQQINLNTLIKHEEKLGLDGYSTITAIDKNMEWHLPFSKILRHHVLRLIGFWIYFSYLLLFMLKSLDLNERLHLLNVIDFDRTFNVSLAIVYGAYFSLCVWSFYFGFLRWFGLSERVPLIYQRIMKVVGLLPVVLIFFIIPLLFLTDEQIQPNANAYLASGLEHSAKGNYKLAIHDFNQAIVLDPNNAGTYFNRGFSYYKKHDFIYAIVDFDKAIALDPQNQRARDLRYEAWEELEKLGKQ